MGAVVLPCMGGGCGGNAEGHQRGGPMAAVVQRATTCRRPRREGEEGGRVERVAVDSDDILSGLRGANQRAFSVPRAIALAAGSGLQGRPVPPTPPTRGDP